MKLRKLKGVPLAQLIELYSGGKHAGGMTLQEIANQFGVTRQAIHRLLCGKVDRVPAPKSEPKPKRELTHGTTGYSRGCRCDTCREACNKYRKSMRSRLKGQEPPAHGLGGYNLYSCRCEECCRANAVNSRKNHAAWIARGIVPHGKISGYNHFGCRCELCKLAKAGR